MSTVIIIPARYESSRLPGKPLIDLCGVSLIKRTWLQATKEFDKERVYVATDDGRIRNHCEEHGMQYVMTSSSCLTGTDRVAEAYKNIGRSYETIINVQGDEPVIPPSDIMKIALAHSKDPKNVCCGYSEIKSEEEFRRESIVKVVFDYDENLLYASRAAIPTNKKLEFVKAYWQVCLYAFSPESLERFVSSKKTRLELIEDVELLRLMELGYKIKMVHLSGNSMSVDVPEDVKKIKEIINGLSR